MSTPSAAVETTPVAPGGGPEPRERRPRLLRPPGLLVFAGVLLLTGFGWWLYADSLTERGVEASGASLVGARVAHGVHLLADADQHDADPADLDQLRAARLDLPDRRRADLRHTSSLRT